MKSLIGTSAVSRESISSTSSLTSTSNRPPAEQMRVLYLHHKNLVLFIVAVALLLDGMLNMVILPLVPEFIKYFKASATSSQLQEYFHFKNETNR
jgi:hypothetical protein